MYLFYGGGACRSLKFHIQSSAVITPSNLSRYCILHCDNSDRKWIRYQNHNRPWPSQASYGVSIVRILDKIDRIITAPHCILNLACMLPDISLWLKVNAVPNGTWIVCQLGLPLDISMMYGYLVQLHQTDGAQPSVNKGSMGAFRKWSSII